MQCVFDSALLFQQFQNQSDQNQPKSTAGIFSNTHYHPLGWQVIQILCRLSGSQSFSAVPEFEARPALIQAVFKSKMNGFPRGWTPDVICSGSELHYVFLKCITNENMVSVAALETS